MMTSRSADIGAPGATTADLGPLAWVLDETRKSIESATKSLKRYAHDAEAARGVDLASVDGSQLRIARQQLHQVVGALDMVGQSVAAQMVRGMEGAVQRFVLHPEKCTDEAARTLERAGFALVEYLESQLGERPRSALGLFPQFAQVQQMAGADRIHPADLWTVPWRWADPAMPAAPQPLTYGPEVRSRLDQRVLKIMKHGDVNAAAELGVISLGLAQGETMRQPSVFWKVSAGFFDALGAGRIPMDVYAKRAASRILLQYTSLARGDQNVSERLAHDLLFFCAQAEPSPNASPVLDSVRQTWSLDRQRAEPYNQSTFGLYDPAVLAQARRRIEAVKENWSALAGGDLARVKACVDQFGLVAESLGKLHDQAGPLALALNSVAQQTASSGKPPSPELAMETATAVLFLEASFADFQPSDAVVVTRMRQLAERLDAVRGGATAPPLESWMEALYRSVSDRQTMGTVVGELRITLSEAEQHLDQFFRHPSDKRPLASLPGLLGQMRGVLSVLGLDQAALAVGRMRDVVDELLATDVDDEQAATSRTFETLGNSLGALGFQIDMLGYQPLLARKLFVYDPASGELKHVTGRVGVVEPAAPVLAAESTVDLALDFDETPAAPAPAAVGQLDEMLPLDTMPGQLEQIAAMAALDDKPALAQAAHRAAEAARHQDEQELSGALQALHQAAGGAAAVTEEAPPTSDDSGDDDLLDIFLEEAREVVQTGGAAIQALVTAPADMEQQTTLRRAFHTLKGSSRMVGLNQFGEAAWSMEQLLNAWLAEQKPVTQDVCQLAGDAMRAFEVWIEDIASRNDAGWSSVPFSIAADALRLEGRRVALDLGRGDAGVAREEPAAAESLTFTVQDELDPTPYLAPVAAEDPSLQPLGDFELPDLDLSPVAAPELEGLQIDEALIAHVPELTPAAPQVDMLEFDLSPDTEEATEGDVEAASEIDFGIDAPDLNLDAPVLALDPAADATWDPFDGDVETVELGATTAPPEDSAPAPSADVPAEPVLDLTWREITAPDAASELLQPEAGAEHALLALSMPDLELGSADSEPLVDRDVDEQDAVAARSEAEGDVVNEASSVDPAQPEAPAEGLQEDEVFAADSSEAPASEEDLYRQIGDLRISTPLYNVYLNEADEWSRQLITELSEWALELDRPVPERAIARAHSLAGSSATVGFQVLSDLARAVEHALQRLLGQSRGTAEQARVLGDASEDIRRVLHQFAAGMLKAPNAGILTAVQALEPAPTQDASTDAAEDTAVASIGADAAPPLPSFGPLTALAPLAGATVTVVDSAPSSRSLADDIDVVDVVDPDLFPIFEEEAEELLPQLGTALRQWVAHADDRGARGQVLRALHTLKGSARLAGALRLGEMAHRTESEIETIGTESIGPADLEPLLDHLDELEAGFRRLQQTGEVTPAPSVPITTDVSPAVVAPVLPSPPTEAAPPEAAPAPAATVTRGDIALPAPLSLASARVAATQAVRVRSQLLDRLVSQAGEVVSSRARLEAEVGLLRGSLNDLTGNLERLRQQLRDVELQAETQMQSRLALNKDAQQNFDPLEFDRFTRMQELTRMMAESVNDVATVQRSLQRAVEASEDDLAAQARQSRELQRDLLRTRMVEFEGLSERLYRVVRQASKETGKQVRLDIVGGSIEMDRGILERMAPAFEHLLRNCVVHGIEAQALRAARHKDATGLISIDVQQAGNDVSVEFRDDGGGLNLPRIRERALQLGLIQPEQSLSDAELANLVFAAGFSTAGEVTELAGRGVGMDVVRTEVQALGGRIETQSREGQGASFRLVLPLTTAVTHVVMLRAGSLAVGVPSNLVEIVQRASAKDLQQAYETGSYRFGDEQLPFFWAGALLQSSARSVEPSARTTPVIVFRSADQRVAIHVDEVLGNQEVVVKALGPQLSRLPGLVAITALASGAVALIYNPVALAAVYGEQARALADSQPDVATAGDVPAAPISVATHSDIPLVLVVDDSITVRRVTQRLLQREGYRVALAADGLQGLEKLQGERPAVILSDIEMPRMDGFDFVRNIRADEQLRDLPVIMITSRIAEKHRDHARQLGVNHYLGKPYAEEELLGLIKDYARAASASVVS